MNLSTKKEKIRKEILAFKGKNMKDCSDSEKNMLRNVMAVGCSLALALLFMVLYLQPSVYAAFREKISPSNILPYGIMVGIFLLACIGFQWIFRKICKQVEKLPALLLCAVSWGVAFVLAILLLVSFRYELVAFDAPPSNLLSYHMNFKATVVGIAGISCAVILLIEKMGKISLGKKQSIFLYGLAFFFGIIYCYALVTPNVFSMWYNVYHTNAYYNSVYNTLCGVPRSEISCSIYGFYSLLLAPVVKLLGGGNEAFFYAVAGIAFVSFMCLAYALFGLVRSNLVKCLGMVAMLLVPCSMQRGIYLQLTPHRVIFPCIMLGYLVFLYKHKCTGWFSKFVGYVLCGLAMVWNFETGIVCLVAYIAFFFIEVVKDYSLKTGKFYIEAVKKIVCAILTVAGSLGFVNVVNLLMGGEKISFKMFIFPFMNDSYFSALLTDYQSGIAAWYFVAVLALVLIGNGISKTKLAPRIAVRNDARASVLFALGVLSLGQMSYYINRAAYGNLGIVFFPAIVMLCVVTDYCLVCYVNHKWESGFLHQLSRAFTYVSLTVLVLVGVGTLYNYQTMQNFRNDNLYREQSAYKTVEEEMEMQLPKDTPALGMSIPTLYGELGWDSQYHLLDVADYGVYPDIYNYLEKELNENIEEPILIENLTLEDIQAHVSLDEFLGKYMATKHFKLYEIDLVYWEPIPKQ